MAAMRPYIKLLCPLVCSSPMIMRIADICDADDHNTSGANEVESLRLYTI